MAWPRWFGLGLLILTTASNARAAGPAAKTWCSEERAAVGKELLTVLTCKPVPSYLIIPYLWTPVSIVIACPSSSFNVYTASSRDQLAEKVAAGASTWCGLTSLADPKSCSLELSAFQQSYVAVRPTRGGATAGCTTKSHASVSFAMIAAVALGAALFYGASPLSTNVAFRISAGTLLFMSGSLVLLAFLLFRVTPHKRVVATVAAALGSTGSFLLRWMYGRWLPFAAQLTSNPWFAAYLGVSAVVGATVTYLMDDTANPKVNNVLRLGLRLGGLLLVFNGTWTQPGMAAAAVALLLLSVALPVVRGWLRGAQQRVEAVTAKGTAYLRARPFSPSLGRHRFASPGPASPLASPLASPRGPTAAHGRAPAMSLAPSSPARPADRPRASTPKHLRVPPPVPWEVARKPIPFEVKMAEVDARRRRAAAATPSNPASASGGGGYADGGGGGAGASYRGASPPPPPRGWLPRRGAGSSSLGGDDDGGEDDAGGGAAGGAGAGAGGEHEQLSPLVQSGMIINGLSSRAIKIGAPTYNDLVRRGWVPDLRQGMLLPPPGGETPTGPAASGSSARRRLPR